MLRHCFKDNFIFIFIGLLLVLISVANKNYLMKSNNLG
jgi:hypothetical protein